MGSNSILSTLETMLTSHAAIYFYIILMLVMLVGLILLLATKITLEKKEKDSGARSGRFNKLVATDKEMKHRKAPAADGEITLSDLCEKFRDFACSRMGLYYDIETVRAFIAGLSVSRLMIFQGISGTGKTSLAFALGRFLGNEAVMVPVQPSWKDRTDLLGYYNEFTGTFNETVLLSKLYEAEYTDDIYITVLDEMNIARVEYYFAEFLSVLELPDSESRTVEVTTDVRDGDPKKLVRGRLHISDNVWFIGTANNDDSTLAISDKVYDRAMVINLDRRAQPFTAPDTPPVSISGKYLYDLFAKARISNSLSSELKAKIERFDAYLIEHLSITFGNRIMTQIDGFVPVFTECGGTEEEAVDIMICRKVLRKLELQNPVYVRSEAHALCDALDSVFGKDSMPICRSYMAKFLKGI